jgi:hypothetical protein
METREPRTGRPSSSVSSRPHRGVSGWSSALSPARLSPAASCPPADSDSLGEISASGNLAEMSSGMTEDKAPLTRTPTISAGHVLQATQIETNGNTKSEPRECESSFNGSKLCLTNTSRSDWNYQSSRRSGLRQTQDFELTRSGAFLAVGRTCRFSRFDSRRKVFSEDEKRNADQRPSTRRKPDRHC